MVIHPEKFEEFQGVLNDSAIALNINEAFATKMIQHQLNNQEKIQEFVDMVKPLTTSEIDENFQEQKETSFWKKIDTNIIHELKLAEPYELFSSYLKNGCTHAQLVELHEKLVN